MERRNSGRVATDSLFIEEKNGDYIYALKAENLSEEGVFLRGKFVAKDQDYVSYLSFRLPNSPEALKDIPALMVRERRANLGQGVAYQFVNMDEPTRIALKKYLLEKGVA